MPANQSSWEQLLRRYQAPITAGLGAGAAARGAAEVPRWLSSMFESNALPLPTGPVVVPVLQVKRKREEEEEENRKIATDYDSMRNMTALAGAGVGGWNLMGSVLNNLRKSRLKSEMNQAKRRFESTLLEEQLDTGVEKTAADKELDEALDKIADFIYVNKSAGAIGTATKGYSLLALLTAAAAGHYGYTSTRANSPKKLTDLALKERRRALNYNSPPEFYAKPVPVEVRTPRVKPREEEEVI